MTLHGSFVWGLVASVLSLQSYVKEFSKKVETVDVEKLIA